MSDRVIRPPLVPPGINPNALILDVVVYWCPIRKEYAAALEDRWGNYWTGPTWSSSGMVFQYDQGTISTGFMLNSMAEDRTSQVLPGAMSRMMRLYMDVLNGETVADVDKQDRYGLLISPLAEQQGDQWPASYQDYLVVRREELMNGPDVWDVPQTLAPYVWLETYVDQRVAWEKAFDIHYPSPRGVSMNSHEVSVRTARSKHKKRLQYMEYRRRRTMREQGIFVNEDEAGI